MSKLTLHFEAAEGTDAAAAEQELKDKLAKLPEVAVAETRAAQYRSIGPAEIVAGIGLALTIANESTAAVQAITKLIDAVKQMVASGKSLRAAFVDVGMRKVPVEELTPADIEKLAAKASA